MEMIKIEKNGVVCAVVRGSGVVLTDAQSIYESNKGKDVFFVQTEAEAVDRLAGNAEN